jgi:hypothetical protein
MISIMSSRCQTACLPANSWKPYQPLEQRAASPCSHMGQVGLRSKRPQPLAAAAAPTEVQPALSRPRDSHRSSPTRTKQSEAKQTFATLASGRFPPPAPRQKTPAAAATAIDPSNALPVDGTGRAWRLPVVSSSRRTRPGGKRWPA